jgi:hypothetical protein
MFSGIKISRDDAPAKPAESNGPGPTAVLIAVRASPPIRELRGPAGG